MSTTNNETKNGLTIDKIEISDTLSQFVEKCNNNFSNIMKCGGGPAGSVGSQGSQGVPTKPKVPIHVWIQGVDYETEIASKDENGNDIFEIKNAYDTSDVKYQAGHLIMLQNAHVYILELDVEDNTLKPNFILALQSYDPGSVIDGKTAIVHIAYANAPNSNDGFVIDQQLTGGNVVDRPYMGIYSDYNTVSSSDPSSYIWFRIQGGAGPKGDRGEQGPQGNQGQPGPKGEDYTAQFFSIDLDGDMSTILLDTDGTTLYDTNDINSYCKCTLHAYYGKTNVKINKSNVTISAPSGYSMGENLAVKLSGQDVGAFTTEQNGNDVSIKFVPNGSFDFRQKTLSFTINVYSKVYDENTKTEYEFERSTIWIIKGIVSDFKLEIIPSHRTIKKLEGGSYYPESLQVNVYKTSGEKREPFNDIYSKDSEFKLLYKDYNDTNWLEYTSDIHKTGISTSGHSCLEFKVVRYPGENEEIWDYEDVWVVADGKGTHYYHADLGSTESMMVLTTGVKKTETINGKVIEYTELRNKNGYSITFNPKFYDGTEELEVSGINIGSNSGEAYYTDGSFVRNLEGNTFTITRVPYGVEVIPMTFVVGAEDINHQDTIAFNVYISTSADLYTLVPSVSSYNTSTGSSGDTIGCDVYKNNIKINQSDLKGHNLVLTYILHSEKNTQETKEIVYTEPIGYSVDDGYGEGNDTTKDIFTASDVAIEFILYCNDKAVVRSSVPLIKDGINGADGDCWQYIFFKTCYDKFDSVVSVFGDGINPSNWDVNNDPSRLDSNAEYLGDKDIEEFLKSHPDKQSIYNEIMSNNSSPWTDNPSGVDKENRYEYQSYRKWDKDNHCWGKYGNPTLYSTYSVDGAPGASAVHMELSQDYIAVPLDPTTNKIHKLYTDGIITNILLYEGGKLINSGITYSFEINNTIYDNNNETTNKKYTTLLEDNIPIIKENNGEFEFHKSLFSKDTYIKCIATYKKESYEKTLFVDLEETPYELEFKFYKYDETNEKEYELNNNVIIRDVNTGELLVDKIEAYLKCWSNGEWLYIGDYGSSLNPIMSIIGYGENIQNGSTNLLNDWLYPIKKEGNKSCFILDKNHNMFNERFKYNTNLESVEFAVWGTPYINNSTTSKRLTYEFIGIIKNGGERGGSGYGVLLSNPISVIPVGDDWKTDENVENQHDSTLVYLYGNSTDVSRQITINIPDNSDDDNLKHFSPTKDDSINKVVFTPVVKINDVDHAFDFGSNAQYKLPIEIKYQTDTDNFTTTTNWTLTPIKGLEDVEVYVDKLTVNTTTKGWHKLRVGYHLTTPNNSKTFIGSKDTNTNTRNYKIILTYDINKLTHSGDDVKTNFDWSDVDYYFIDNEQQPRNCFVVLLDSNNNIIDYTVVIAVSDGADGADGIIKFKSTVFTRSDNKPTIKPTGGDFDTPTPDYKDGDTWKWEDGIPDGNGLIWSSYRWFSNEKGFKSDWSDPVLMCDTPDFEVIYSSLKDISSCNPNNATAFYKDTNGGISGWLNDNKTYFNDKWSDDGGTDSIWMATINKTDGKWGKWTISKIKGESGTDGAPAIHLELTQDYIAVPSKPGGGGVHADYDGEIKSEMMLYAGDKQIIEDIRYAITVGTSTKSWDHDNDNNINGEFTINTKITHISSDTTIRCSATYNNITYRKDLFIDLEETPYELELNKNVLVRDVNNNNQLTDDSLTVLVKYWMSGNWKNATGGEIRVNNKKAKDYSNTTTTTIDNLSTYISDSDTEVRISYYKDETELSYEILGIINNGKNGTNGGNGKTPELIDTTIVGFSIKADETPDESGDWKTSIDKLGELNPGQQIYILYKQKWTYKEDKNTIFYTYYISTTMAGTQGIDGKSRVLFYLGSFKNGTLKGDVYGKLNDERCDYYIDANGKAWMRINKAAKLVEDVIANSDGKNNSTDYWTESETVGFLQAGAITADMINTATIAVDNAFITNLQITNANISEKITASKIDVSEIQITNANISEKITASKIDASGLKIGDNNIDDNGISAKKIKVSEIQITNANITGALSGHTIESSSNAALADGTQGSAWKIKNEGDGWFAKKNIEWDIYGNITIKGKIETSKGSKLGSWYTWEDGTISTKKEGSPSTVPAAVQFNSDGSGHLCYQNISWDKSGKLFLGALGDNEVVIGNDAWIVTNEGIKTSSNSAVFNNNGSGHIGGITTSGSTSYQKGISWDASGNVTFHDRLCIKPRYLTLTGNEKENSTSFLDLISSDKSTYIFISDTNNTPDDTETDPCFKIYLSWFNNYCKEILDEETICIFSLINHTNRTLNIIPSLSYINIPYRISRDNTNVLHNYNFKTSSLIDEISGIYILPGSKLELLVDSNTNSDEYKTNLYINNISDFRLAYNCYDDENESNRPCLMSTNYDVNSFSNVGGLTYLNKNGQSDNYYTDGFIRLIFGNYCPIYKAVGYCRLPAYTWISTLTGGNNSYILSSYRDKQEGSFIFNFNTVYDNTFEFLISPEPNDYDKDGNCKYNSLPQFIFNFTKNDDNYKSVKVGLYSLVYQTMFWSNSVDISSINTEITVMFSDEDLNKIHRLAEFQPNRIMDMLVQIEVTK